MPERPPMSRRRAAKLLLAGAVGAAAGAAGHPTPASAAGDPAADETITGTWTFDPESGRIRVADGARISFGTGNIDGAKVSLTSTGRGLELDNSLVLRKDRDDRVGPELILKGKNGGWLAGIDVAADIGSRDFVPAAKLDYPAPGNVNDFLYCSHNGDRDPSLGIGKAQPGSAYRTWIVGWTQTENREMGTLRLQAGSRQTGNVLVLTDWGGIDHVWIDPDGWDLHLREGKIILGQAQLTAADVKAIKDRLAKPPVVRGRRGRPSGALRQLLAALDDAGVIRNRTRR